MLPMTGLCMLALAAAVGLGAAPADMPASLESRRASSSAPDLAAAATGPAATSRPAAPENPRWKVLALVCTATDFKYSDDKGEHHLVAKMTDEEKKRAETRARRFFDQDVPALTEGNQRPILTVKLQSRPLTKLEKGHGYWPSRAITAPDIGPEFDSVVVIWKSGGTDQVTGKPINVAGAGGLAAPMGKGQTYCSFPVDYISAKDRNVFKHEWGHSILFYFDAAGKTAMPAVDNHINDKDKRYVHWPTGEAYILKDETDDDPIPDSIYHNARGFTHDYYSGQTATADQPKRHLGITPEAWASGGPVTKPTPKVRVDCDFPGGNILVDGIEGDVVHLRPDLRDTEGWWFHWGFRAGGARGKALRFEFAGGAEVNPQSARAFGRDMARALSLYLRGAGPTTGAATVPAMEAATAAATAAAHPEGRQLGGQVMASIPEPGPIIIRHQPGSAPVDFAVTEIRAALVARSQTASALPLEAEPDAAPGLEVVLAAGAAQAADAARRLGLAPPKHAAGQSYAIRAKRDGRRLRVAVLGADPVGTMYGGLDVAEAIRIGTLAELADSDHAPHIEQRGIKFNIPLDLRTPSYSDNSDAAQQNMPEMWSIEFWRGFLDEMARHRLNVLTLWSLHPFPSLVKVPEFPDVALDDVWRSRRRFDETFDHSGRDMLRPEYLRDVEVIRRMTIADKIRFWRDVMGHARDRGIDVYWFTWNIFTFGAEGKHGIRQSQTDQTTIAYFRASIRELVLTYPLLAGVGVTAGEQMASRSDECAKEQWLWKTYGEGVRDALSRQPGRPFRIIHRFHQTGLDEIERAWKDLPCRLDLSFKYAIAHMYSIPDPPFIRKALPHLSPQRRTWLTVRNDDIYSFRWGDPDYARAFVRAIPGPDKVAGFYMGPDGYTWGRDFLTKDAGDPRPLVIQKQWYSFLLWGRLSYDPDLPDETFRRIVSARFPQVDGARLYQAWADASRVFPHITRFFWGDIDLRWFPEACLSHPRHRGYYTVRHFIEGGTMPGAGIASILDWRRNTLASEPMSEVTPLAVADTLQKHADAALEGLEGLKGPEGREGLKGLRAGEDRELRGTLGDIEAMAHLGRYYAAKVRGACELALFDKTGEGPRRDAAVKNLQEALGHWKRYADAYTRQYAQPILYNRVGWVDIPRLVEKAAADVQAARDWKPGTVDDAKLIRRGGDEPFRR